MGETTAEHRGADTAASRPAERVHRTAPAEPQPERVRRAARETPRRVGWLPRSGKDQYAAGSGLSIGVENCFRMASLMGRLRFMPRGGIGCSNHRA